MNWRFIEDEFGELTKSLRNSGRQADLKGRRELCSKIWSWPMRE